MKLLCIKTIDGREFRMNGEAAETAFQKLIAAGFDKTNVVRDYILIDRSHNEIPQTVLINKAHIVSVTLTEEN